MKRKTCYLSSTFWQIFGLIGVTTILISLIINGVKIMLTEVHPSASNHLVSERNNNSGSLAKQNDTDDHFHFSEKNHHVTKSNSRNEFIYLKDKNPLRLKETLHGDGSRVFQTNDGSTITLTADGKVLILPSTL
jgi:hypothetical protein